MCRSSPDRCDQDAVHAATAECCPATSQPFALYGRACKGRDVSKGQIGVREETQRQSHSRSTRPLCEPTKRATLHISPHYVGEGLRLSDNMVGNLVPEAGPFGRYQVLSHFRALTSAQLVDLPDFFGHGASCGGTLPESARRWPIVRGLEPLRSVPHLLWRPYSS